MKKITMKCTIKISAAILATVFLICGHSTQLTTFADETNMVYGFNAVDGGIVWYQYDGTLLKNSWLEFRGKHYYFDENGYVCIGEREIDGVTYTFGPDCALIGDAPGSTTSVPEGTTINPGYDVTRDQLKVYCDYIVNTICTPEMSQFNKLKACYKFIIDHTSYVRTYETPAGDWTPSFANQVYLAGTGNCYRYAAAFAYLAKDLGYETKVITGQVPSKKGGMTPHSWTEVSIDGKYYLFDTELEDANGVDHFMKTYETNPNYVKKDEWDIHF